MDHSKLLGLMKEKGYTQETLAAKIGVSRASLCNKLGDNGEFRMSEIASIAGVLGISQDDIGKYFFVPKSCESATATEESK